MSRAWRHFLSNGLSGRLERRLGLFGSRAVIGGLLVEIIIPGGPAEDAGFKEGDVLAALAGRPVKGLQHLHRLLGHLRSDHPYPAVLRRKGRAFERWVLLRERCAKARR